jgi:hypothetical protein
VVYTRTSQTSQAENTLRMETRGCGKICGKLWTLIENPQQNQCETAAAKKITAQNSRVNQNFFFFNQKIFLPLP